MLNRLHHVAGLWHGYTLINVWGAATALVSILLMGIGLTGVYLWFKIYGERKIGTALLALNMTVALTLIYLMRSA